MKKLNFKNYKYRSVTGGRNGYPIPEQGVVIFGTLQELKELKAFNHNTEYVEVHWREGWSNCQITGYTEPVLYNSIVMSQFANDNNKFDFVKTSDTTATYKDCNGDEQELFVNLGYFEDTHNYKVGVFFPNDFFVIDWENETIQEGGEE